MRAVGLKQRIGVVAAGLVVSIMLIPSAASASLAGLERASATGPLNSSNKSQTVGCGPARRVLSAGAIVSPDGGFGGFNQVLLDDIRPSADLTSVTVFATEDETGTPENWSITAYALCAYPPPGLERVAATSPLSSAAKGVTASCPAGKRVLGSGSEINSFVGQVHLDDIHPSPNLGNVTVNATEDETGNPTNWSVTAYAICATPVAGLHLASANSALDSTASKSAPVQCPDGKRLIGTGAAVNTFNGQVVLNGIVPLETTDFAEALEDETGNSAPWSVTGYAICANASKLVTSTSPSNSATKERTAACPSGFRPTGGGGDVVGGSGQVLMDGFRPSATSFRTLAFEDGDGLATSWALSSHAICAAPAPRGYAQSFIATPATSQNKSVTVSCAPGKRVIGAAGETGEIPGSGGSQSGLGQVILDDISPNADLTSVTVNGLEDETSTRDEWRLNAWAICATPPPGLERVAVFSELDSATTKDARAACPAGKTLLGGGYSMNTFNGQVVPDDLTPNPGLNSITVTAYEDEDGNAANWSITAYAICANV